MRPDSALEPAEIDVWTVGLDLAPEQRDALAETLSADERERAARFLFERDRQRFIAARGWLRLVLGSCCGRPPADVVFTYGPRGKPALAGEGAGGLRFNLAHASGRALIALARGRDVGVDLEDLQRAGNWEGVSARFFTPREAAAILERPAAARSEAFLACWTRKEAYVKARGEGLTLALDGFEVSVDPDEEQPRLRSLDEAGPCQWSLHSLRPVPGFIAALAVAGRSARMRRLTADTPWTSSIRSVS
jgi:4'-phosphopantetheinyl transferase